MSRVLLIVVALFALGFAPLSHADDEDFSDGDGLVWGT